MKVFVFMDCDGQTIQVGQLYAEHRGERLTSAFSYRDEYLSNQFAYDPVRGQ